MAAEESLVIIQLVKYCAFCKFAASRAAVEFEDLERISVISCSTSSSAGEGSGNSDRLSINLSSFIVRFGTGRD